MKRKSHLALVCAIVVLTANTYAQTAGPGAATPSASAPAAVGTSSQTAIEANQKAVPRSDTGSLVRTSPSVPERARQATSPSDTNTSGRATETPDQAQVGSPLRPSRPARADRN